MQQRPDRNRTRIVRGIGSLCLLLILFGSCYSQELNAPAVTKAEREVAITFDDLPAVGPYDLRAVRDINTKLLATITANKIPALGFVTGWQVDVTNQRNERLAVLEEWLDRGLELGNHTFKHSDFHKNSLNTFKQDVIRGEAPVKQLLDARKLKLKYFRHPYLHTGINARNKEAADRFLRDRGYVVAPVTHDNQEWIFAIVYDRAWKRRDKQALQRIGSVYLDYMNALFEYYEKLSRDLFGYEIRQVLLLHDNRLNADFLPDLVRMMKERGYNFVSLERALQDPAYASSNTYVGPLGPSWLQRWAISRGATYEKEPAVPEYIMDQYDRKTGQSPPSQTLRNIHASSMK